MSIKYDSKREPLAEIIKKATDNATYVIPDLQRPYVWTPRQVTLLIDSLFRSWPFGSLLLWEVKPDCFKRTRASPIDRSGRLLIALETIKVLLLPRSVSRRRIKWFWTVNNVSKV